MLCLKFWDFEMQFPQARIDTVNRRDGQIPISAILGEQSSPTNKFIESGRSLEYRHTMGTDGRSVPI